MLQRVYGYLFESKDELDHHLWLQEEAKRRDHRRLGEEMDLFSFPEELGGGLAVWHPKGARIRKLIEDYSRLEHDRGGYEFVYSPHITKSNLFETSGHLDFYADSMYPPMRMQEKDPKEVASYYPKPMNCPFHCLIYRSRPRSYRELPLRLFELGTVYRYERSGALHGMLRVRSFTQDDAHIFVPREGVAAELSSLLDFVLKVVRTFGFDDFTAYLSTRPTEKSIGEDADWEMAESGLRSAIEAAGIPYELDEGGGAFYGPKIDLKLRDGVGREWQLSTIQLDFQLPQRFELEYIGSDGAAHRPIMIHRALFGSVERFFATLVEHYAGVFPVWLAPEQLRLVPITDSQVEFCQQLAAQARQIGLRVDVDDSDDRMQAKIRKATVQKVPFIGVVGKKEVEAGTVSVRLRNGDDRGVMPTQELIDLLAQLDSSRANEIS
jgi:threonyl-tRNA synthetase